MKRTYLWVFLLGGLLLGLTACREETTNNANGEAEPQLGPLEWNRDPGTILLRVDQQYTQGTPAQIANEIPLCTVWGDGRAIWMNTVISAEDGTSSSEILEGQLGDDAIRQLIETVVFSGFYDWESNFMLPDFANPEIQSLTLNLFSEERTVSRYGDWPVNGFERIREACSQASTAPAIFLPDGAWISAYEVPYDTTSNHWRWFTEAAGFNLAEISAGQAPRWITGDLAKYIFTTVILSDVDSRALDGDLAYQLAIQVPNVTRDAPPAPAP